MPRPTGVTIAAVVLALARALIGFLALTMLFASFGLVQDSGGTTGMFGNGLLGGLGLFFGTILVVVAAAMVCLSVGLWRMRKWARVGSISLLGPCLIFFAIALLRTMEDFHADAFFVGALCAGTTAWMIWYLSQAEVKEAIGA